MEIFFFFFPVTWPRQQLGPTQCQTFSTCPKSTVGNPSPKTVRHPEIHLSCLCNTAYSQHSHLSFCFVTIPPNEIISPVCWYIIEDTVIYQTHPIHRQHVFTRIGAFYKLWTNTTVFCIKHFLVRKRWRSMLNVLENVKVSKSYLCYRVSTAVVVDEKSVLCEWICCCLHVLSALRNYYKYYTV